MSILISNDDYKEYRVLQNNAIFQQKLNSVRGMNNVKNDIDEPIRTLIAMFALLGCEPIWSCCGFDYEGQPMHKTHEYGSTYIVIGNNTKSQEIIKSLLFTGYLANQHSKSDKWETWMKARSQICLQTDFDYFHTKTKYPWATRSCIHFSELALIKIGFLERVLLHDFGSNFADNVILSDGNKEQKKHLRNWQYPILEDWIIKKEEVLPIELLEKM